MIVGEDDCDLVRVTHARPTFSDRAPRCEPDRNCSAAPRGRGHRGPFARVGGGTAAYTQRRGRRMAPPSSRPASLGQRSDEVSYSTVILPLIIGCRADFQAALPFSASP